MTRDEALEALGRFEPISFDDEQVYRDLRTYILNSIPMPTVEVVKEEPEALKCKLVINGRPVGTWISAYIMHGHFTNALIAALKGGRDGE